MLVDARRYSQEITKENDIIQNLNAFKFILDPRCSKIASHRIVMLLTYGAKSTIQNIEMFEYFHGVLVFQNWPHFCCVEGKKNLKTKMSNANTI